MRVETPVRRVVVLRLAAFAHRERRHGREGPVVGHPAGDGEPRAVFGAVGKGVPVAAISRREHLGQTRRAGGQVRRDRDPAIARRGGLDDVEVMGRSAVQDADGNRVEARGRRRVGAEFAFKLRERRVIAEHRDRHAGPVIADPAGQVVLCGKAVDPGPESDPLHSALDLESPSVG